jgi:hypothetical protein
MTKSTQHQQMGFIDRLLLNDMTSNTEEAISSSHTTLGVRDIKRWR